ncbi:MAG: hypothetical protein JSV88_13675 [Candidatus Aminicenantes bacterium]|nr:MAG: hypothetical protein JSV88_13675 [Candidatus Aminicenantes bacterium]
MVKKLFFILLVVVFVFTINNPVFAQEEEEREVEDIEEFSLEELLNVEITTAGLRPERIGDIPASVIKAHSCQAKFFLATTQWMIGIFVGVPFFVMALIQVIQFFK